MVFVINFLILFSFLTLNQVVFAHLTILNSKKEPNVKCSSSSLPQYETRIKEYNIDLDLSPKLRWRSIATLYKYQIRKMILYIRSFVGEHVTNFALSIMSKLLQKMPPEYRYEITGISEVIGLTFEEVGFFNIFYEIFTVCTSIVAYDSEGNPIHARNLDFGIFMGWDKNNHSWAVTEILRGMTVQINWMKNNITVAKSINFAGYIGVLTGMNMGKLSISLNERFNIDGGFIGLFKWMLTNKGVFAGFLIREVILSTKSTDELIQNLLNVKFIAPNYLIVATEKKAHIITRSRGATVDNYVVHNKDPSNWYVLQTNYDHWEKAPFFDDRITPGNYCMNKINRSQLNAQKIFEVLQTRPVLNRLTVFTAFMHLKTGKVYAHLVNCPSPCPIW